MRFTFVAACLCSESRFSTSDCHQTTACLCPVSCFQAGQKGAGAGSRYTRNQAVILRKCCYHIKLLFWHLLYRHCLLRNTQFTLFLLFVLVFSRLGAGTGTGTVTSQPENIHSRKREQDLPPERTAGRSKQTSAGWRWSGRDRRVGNGGEKWKWLRNKNHDRNTKRLWREPCQTHNNRNSYLRRKETEMVCRLIKKKREKNSMEESMQDGKSAPLVQHVWYYMFDVQLKKCDV